VIVRIIKIKVARRLRRTTAVGGLSLLAACATVQIALLAFGGLWLWGAPSWLRYAIWTPIVCAELAAFLVGWRMRRSLDGKILFCCAVPLLLILSSMPFEPRYGVPRTGWPAARATPLAPRSGPGSGPPHRAATARTQRGRTLGTQQPHWGVELPNGYYYAVLPPAGY
jgi:hypothetical protein